MDKIPFAWALLLLGCDKARTSESTVPAPPTQMASTQLPGRTRAVPSAAPPKSTPFAFDADAAGSAPRGFAFGRTGGGAPGRWIVQADSTAISAPNVLAQVDADATNFRFPVAVTEQSQPADVRVSVRCKMISGRVDQACGLVLRYANADNYFITRANALEDNVRLYWVKEGKRNELASHGVEVTPNVWHEYGFEAKADSLRVWWEGKLVIEHRDATFSSAGAVGMWTKADSVTYFDDFRIEPL